jgi:hypothetical protein
MKWPPSTLTHDLAHNDHAHDHPTGWRRWIYSTNHKDIGTMYLIFAICAGIVGAAMSVAIRIELMYPGIQIFHETHTYNVFVTSHGLIMIFFMVMSAMIGGNVSLVQLPGPLGPSPYLRPRRIPSLAKPRHTQTLRHETRRRILN